MGLLGHLSITSAPGKVCEVCNSTRKNYEDVQAGLPSSTIPIAGLPESCSFKHSRLVQSRSFFLKV